MDAAVLGSPHVWETNAELKLVGIMVLPREGCSAGMSQTEVAGAGPGYAGCCDEAP